MDKKFTYASLITVKHLTASIMIYCGKTLLEMGIQKHLIQLLKGLYEDLSAAIRTEFGDTDRFQIKKGVRQGCILSPFLFNLYAERIMRKAEMEETKEGVKIAGKTLNNLRYADDTC